MTAIMDKPRVDKKGILVNMPADKLERMQKTMKRQRISNQTAFIINAVEAVCAQQEQTSSTEKLEKALSILSENARIDREQAARRHMEMMAWIDTLAQVVCATDEEYEKFQIAVNHEFNQRRGAE
jgi:hypothetical protein